MKKIIIIGAGPAGLTAASELLDDSKEKYDITILEESNDIGGISKTVKYNGNRMDIGGHRFFSKDKRVMDFWMNLMPIQGQNSFDDEKLGREKPLVEGGPNPEKEDEVLLVRDRVSRIYYLKKFFDYPISLKLKTFTNMGLIRTIKSGFSYLKSIFFKKKEDSLENFYINRFGKVLYSMFFEKYTEKLWGRHPSNISADWGAQRVKGVSISAVLKDSFSKLFGRKNKNKGEVETSLIEQFYYPKFGPGQLWEELAKKVEEKGVKICKNHSVQKVLVKNNKVTSVMCNVDGKIEEFEGDVFISSMPLKDLVEDITGEEVPKEELEIAKGLPYVDFQTVGVLVNKMKLENETKIKTINNIVPDCWIYIQEPEVKMLRIQIFNNWSPYLVKDIGDKVWIGIEYTCKEGDEYWNMSDEEFSQFAINELASINIIDKNDVVDYHRERIKKAYPAYFDTYKDIDKLIKYIDTIDNLYCIGRNGQHHYNNMDHSMATAMEAAKNIKEGIKEKDNIWNVNTEKSYHEEKKS
ncbi:MAG: NAD(P)/FAD-dependent oxidoreductase [Clostridia bacterium]|nr:NAD(P)/FAD-dependent oxidoreductase [Clostridia bacterium]